MLLSLEELAGDKCFGKTLVTVVYVCVCMMWVLTSEWEIYLPDITDCIPFLSSNLIVESQSQSRSPQCKHLKPLVSMEY